MNRAQAFHPDRRRFLKATAAVAGGALLIGINWSRGVEAAEQEADGSEDFQPNAWVALHADGRVEITVAESEMGQGPYTLMPMLVAEELEVPWSSISVLRAGVDPVYGFQLTGGSTSIKKGWVLLREAGAIARQLLLMAAARQWGIAPERCRARDGQVFDDSGRSIAYTRLVGLAASLPMPDKAWLKPPEDFHVIGQPLPRTDVPQKVTGQAVYGIDVRRPGQLFATVVHPPVFGGRLRAFDDTGARESPAVVDVFAIDQGVAVVARDTWSAFKAAQRLSIDWDPGERSGFRSQDWEDRLRGYDARPPSREHVRGTPEAVTGDRIEAEYLQPFQAHMTLEPMNCCVHFDDGKLRIWAPTQSPSLAYGSAKRLTQNRIERGWHKLLNKVFGGYDDSIEVNTTLLGGGFGRRLEQDYVEEAIQIAARFEVPVQLVWTREQDVRNDFYHPMTYHRMAAELDAQGMPRLWLHDIAGGGVSSWGARHDYAIPHQRIRSYDFEPPIPKGPWRSVAPHFNVFAVEHFIDELARQAGHDPLDYRLQLLPDGRLKRCLLRLAERVKADGLNKNERIGYAAASTFDSHVAEAVVLRDLGTGRYRVDRVYCVIDCGIVINPDIVRQQMESSIVYGLTAATLTEITVENGQVQQSNFHDVPALRLHQLPEIFVDIVDSTQKPGGLGEPGVPPLAPALANAWLASTGKPLRRLPLRLS